MLWWCLVPWGFAQTQQIEEMKATMELYVSEVTKAAEVQENSHKHEIQKMRRVGENAVEKVRKELSVERNIIDDRWKDRLEIIESKYRTISNSLNEKVSSQFQKIASLQETVKKQNRDKMKVDRELRRLQKRVVLTEKELKERADEKAQYMLKSPSIIPPRLFGHCKNSKERSVVESENVLTEDNDKVLRGRRRLHSTSLLRAWN